MSLSEKTKKWLAENCGVSLGGKTVAVTGANSGIGFKTAELAVYLGADVILACRNPERAAAAREKLLRDYPGSSVSVMALDLASFKSIDAFVDALRTNGTDIDVFVNNAGVFRHPGKTTADGFELVLGTNYFGVYHLSEEIMPYLETLPHEVDYVNTVSLIHKVARAIDYGDFYFEKKRRNALALYARSKICLAKYTYALAKRCEGTNVRVLMNHPGIAVTPLGLNAFGQWVTKLAGVLGGIFNSPEKSALSFAYIVSHDLKPGSIVGPTKLLGGWGYPKENRILRKVKAGGDVLISFTENEIRQKTGPR